MKNPWFEVGWTEELVQKEVEQDSVVLYLHAFDLGLMHVECAPIGFLLPHRLEGIPAFPIFHINDAVNVGLLPPVEITLTKPQLQRLRRFNSLMMRFVYLRHRDDMKIKGNAPNYVWEHVDYDQWNEEYILLAAPLVGSLDDIHWPIIDHVFALDSCIDGTMEGSSLASALQRLPSQVNPNEHFIATDVLDYQRRLIITDIRTDLSPSSAVMKDDTDQLPTNSKIDGTYAELYQHAYCRIPYTGKVLPSIDMMQPLCKTVKSPVIRNYLQPMDCDKCPAGRENVKLPPHRIPQFLILNPFPGIFI